MADYNEVLPSSSISTVVTESQLLKSGTGIFRGILTTATSSGTLVVIDGTEASTAATTDLTSSGACVPASHGQTELTSSGAMVAGTHAVSVLTGDAVVAGNVVVIGSVTYTARLVPSVAYDVALGANTEAFLANLYATINGTATPAQAYDTPVNTQVVAVAKDATTLTVRGRVPGTSLNSVATTGTALRTVWADTTLGGGTGASDAGVTTAAATVTIGDITYTVVDELSETYGATAIPYQVKKGASEATMLDNLKLAINATASGVGTLFSTGTVAHPYVIATTNSDTVQKIVSRTIGTAAATAIVNGLATTETMANTAWADTTFGGGTGNSNPAVTSDAALITLGNRVYTATLELSETSGATAVADQILWVTSEAVFLDNIKKAVNGSGIAGTDYSTGTTPHTQVVATTNTNTVQTFVSRLLGTVGNSYATSDTLANYAFTSTVMASGAGATGKTLLSTYTPTAGLNPETFNLEFSRGLYVTVGGTSIASTFFYR
jgi:hypothetical protein